MKEQEQTSVEYLLAILDNLLGDKIFWDFSIYKQICISAREKYEKELKESFEKGCLKGYNDHVKLTNTLYK